MKPKAIKYIYVLKLSPKEHNAFVAKGIQPIYVAKDDQKRLLK